MKVYLDDDARTCPETGKMYRATPGGWERAWTYEEAIAFLKTGKVTEISLDNDLGTEKEGRHVVDWISNAVAHSNFPIPKIWIHSANTPAQEYMVSAIRNLDRVRRLFRDEDPSDADNSSSE